MRIIVSKYLVGMVVLCTMVLTIVIPPVQAQTLPATANPNYFYNRETAFIIEHAFDPVNGGIYLAVAPDGSLLPPNALAADSEVIWGVPAALFAGNPIEGTDKSLYGHGTCIRYFITEYQRVEYLESINQPGIRDLNAALRGVGSSIRIRTPEDLLDYARSCADFVIGNLIIDKTDDGVIEDPWNYDPPPPGGGGEPDIGDVVIPNRLFYWSSVSADGTNRFVDDTLHVIASQPTAPRTESIVAWSMVELARALNRAGAGGSAIYRNHAIDWWDWRFSDADTLPFFNDPTPPPPDDFTACPVPTGGGTQNNCIAGGARDLFLAPLGYALGGTYATDAIAYIDTWVISPTNDTRVWQPFPRSTAIQDSTYVAGYSRAALYSDMLDDGVPIADIDQYWDFGNNPARNYDVTAPGSVFPDISQPFVHFNGREIMAGTQRALWFYYTYGQNPNDLPFIGVNFADEDLMRESVISLWDYINDQLWDPTPGQEAWFESTKGAYKPCFSAGTDLPIGDWAAPLIGNKVHDLNPDGSATVSVTNVVDEDFAYMSWDFRGAGVTDVEVVYTIDGGATWVVLPATEVGGNDYEATIPAQPDGTRVYYYARAADGFLNRTSFPSGAEVWNDLGETISQSIGNSQTYFVGEIINDDGEMEEAPAEVLVDDITIAKSVFPPVASPGETVDWSITVSNMGTEPTGNISVTDNVPDELTIISAVSNTGTVTINGQQVTLTVDSLPVGGQAVVTITTEVNADVEASLLFNSVSGVSAQLIVVGALPQTGETPWWHPCRLVGRCE